MSIVDGLVLIDKPENITSFSALGSMKKKLETKKIGHTGTLDKFASGLLVVVAGSYTRLADHVTGMSKEYVAEFEFGKETDTLDPEGEIVMRSDLPSREDIYEKLREFTGTILQRPPQFSAIHLNGKRAHELARSGRTVEIPERPVTISSINVISYEEPFLRVSVACGKGTYIRSLARDLGRSLGSCAYVTQLRRTRVGAFHVNNAVKPEDFDRSLHLRGGKDILENIFPGEILTVRRGKEEFLKRGSRIDESFFLEEKITHGVHPVLSIEDDLVALVEYMNGGFSYRFVAA